MTYQLVAFLESMMTTLGTIVAHLLTTAPTEGLIALETVIRVGNQVEADYARKGLFEEPILPSWLS